MNTKKLITIVKNDTKKHKPQMKIKKTFLKKTISDCSRYRQLRG